MQQIKEFLIFDAEGINIMKDLFFRKIIRRLRLVCIITACSRNYCFSQAFSDTAHQVKASYGERGFQLQTRDDKFLIQIQSRLQFRFATPGDQDPLNFDDYHAGNHPVFKINRARLKVGGYAFKTWLTYYWEYELSQSNLLDFRIMVEKWKAFSLKVGQWKMEFTRERFISSGEQQLIERSLINRPFTLDRQQGIELYGHLKWQGPLDFNYWAAVLTGTGRGNTKNDDASLMYFGRIQWNFLGRSVPFEGGDLEYHEKPAAIIALAAVTNRSPYTRFSQAGGGSLEGFENGLPGQYRVNQTNLETALMYRGFSWQSEWHHKNIINTLDSNKLTLLRGFYVQAGYFFHGIVDWCPSQLEVAARHAEYKPNEKEANNLQQETSFDLNWFFNGHKNKLTTEISYFSSQDQNLNLATGWRYRLQWDISL